tara:strand:+ start:1130 stop:1978 length:849 start_codon:yes stop_codon:yes gene_type:complete
MIIYTCITNGYDEIPDNHYYDPDVQYVCFTDGSITHKGPWEFREIPIEYDCPRRRSAYVKMCPHKVFPQGSKTVWLDGCYIMTKKFVENSKKYLTDYDFTVMRHPVKFSYMDEVLEGYECAMHTWDEVITITKAVKEVGYNFFRFCNPVLASIWRVLDNYDEFGDLWWKYSLIGINRDQISFDTARQLTKTELKFIEDGWLGNERDSRGARLAGSVGINFGDFHKQWRRKRHPQPGNMDQYKNRDAMIEELRKLTGLPPKLYARANHSQMIDWNVLNPRRDP